MAGEPNKAGAGDPAGSTIRREGRNRRRTIADAVEVVREDLGIAEIAGARVEIGPL
jgi:hypothetical protein